MGRGWNTHIKLKHLLTDEETPEAINASMKAIATALRKSSACLAMSRVFLRDMEECTDQFEGNELLAALYDYADAHRIWIE